MEIQKIAVIGAGIMGGGIAQAAAMGGFSVILLDINEDLAAAGLRKIASRLHKNVGQGKLTGPEKKHLLSLIRTSAGMEECQGVDLVIEAVVEKEQVKKQLFKKLDGICPQTTIFTSNTSSISITRLGRATERPERFVGMHFMNPAHVMKLVEVIKGSDTSEQVLRLITAVAEKMGKVPVTVNDSPGFVANRILMPMLNEAVFSLQEGVGSREAIDTIMQLGAHHPMGPLALADLIGLDTCLAVLEVLHAELGEKYRPCALLRTMVSDGKLGKKSGEGFYTYAQ